jgi:hypothetical protein
MAEGETSTGLQRDVMSMNKQPRNPDSNVVRMRPHPRAKRGTAVDLPAQAAAPGGAGDPRMQEALRLIAAFLAIDDDVARGALITMAERLVTYDWVRKTQHR